MKIFVKTILIVAATGFLGGCFYSLPVATVVPQNNETYEVDYLFEHDGCKVYRFYDGGHWVYFTNCRGNVTSIKNDSTAETVTNSIRVTYDHYDDIQKANPE